MQTLNDEWKTARQNWELVSQTNIEYSIGKRKIHLDLTRGSGSPITHRQMLLPRPCSFTKKSKVPRKGFCAVWNAGVFNGSILLVIVGRWIEDQIRERADLLYKRSRKSTSGVIRCGSGRMKRGKSQSGLTWSPKWKMWTLHLNKEFCNKVILDTFIDTKGIWKMRFDAYQKNLSNEMVLFSLVQFLYATKKVCIDSDFPAQFSKTDSSLENLYKLADNALVLKLIKM